jgi:U5 small nuclear ribonucleoprotein component
LFDDDDDDDVAEQPDWLNQHEAIDEDDDDDEINNNNNNNNNGNDDADTQTVKQTTFFFFFFFFLLFFFFFFFFQRMSTAIVLHEDKQYYASASSVYGADVEVLVEDEDRQAIDTPLVAPTARKVHTVLEDGEFAATTFGKQFLCELLEHPAVVRNVALVGHLHHGKTTLLDTLVQQTHEKKWSLAVNQRYADSTLLEQARGLSVRATAMSFVLPSSRGKSHVINIVDTPGHTCFAGELVAGTALADGVMLVVDVCEGVMMQTKRAIELAMRDQLPIVLCLAKLDRLILELKLPPNDAYYKLRHTIDHINDLIAAAATASPGAPPQRLSPELGNVLFSAACHGWSFTLPSFAAQYAALHANSFDSEKFAARLWGDVYFDSRTRRFARRPAEDGGARTFVQFVLEPIYKLYSHVIAEEDEALDAVIAELGLVALTAAERRLDAAPLLKLVCSRFFGPATGFVDLCVAHVPSPAAAAEARVARYYRAAGDGDEDAAVRAAMLACDANGPLMVHVTKLYPTDDARAFVALGRVVSGTLRLGDRLRVMGENYSADDVEDMALADVTSLAISEARYAAAVPAVPAGAWALIGGVDENIVKTATLAAANDPRSAACGTFRALRHITEAVVRVAVEPLNPSELPKMVAGLRAITKTYPLVSMRVEESGEHVVIGTGELQLDCALHDLRRLYSDIEVKVADPVVAFCETVLETSQVKCFAVTPNKKNRLTMIGEPLDKGLASDIESGAITLEMPAKERAEFLKTRYQWDTLAARAVWAFGPDSRGPNVLLDDTLPTEVDKVALGGIRASVVQGFQWATREGPLCESPIRGVKFRLLDATVADAGVQRGGGQVIPTARRVAYSAFLTAAPRLMEPVYAVEIQCSSETVASVYTVLSRRRGHVIEDAPIAGSPLYRLDAYLPAIESFGFETDLRSFTQGQAFCVSAFNHWALTPGDPLDTSIVLQPLQVAPVPHLAREFMVKTRRRKGLAEDVAVERFFEPELAAAIKRIEQEQAARAQPSNPFLIGK